MHKCKIIYSKEYKRAIKKFKKDIHLIESIIDKLASGETLESKYKDHKLKGEYKDFRECHIKPDL
ncbi:type II toxin-antitoxin system YafQ family toxin, partial [Helicobacter cappadocius]